jgi:hypothetical protein
MNKVVTCPETLVVEMIEYADTPLGMLIHRCTRFRPACALDCTRDCAALFERQSDPIIRVGDDGCALDATIEIARRR